MLCWCRRTLVFLPVRACVGWPGKTPAAADTNMGMALSTTSSSTLVHRRAGFLALLAGLALVTALVTALATALFDTGHAATTHEGGGHSHPATIGTTNAQT